MALPAVLGRVLALLAIAGFVLALIVLSFAQTRALYGGGVEAQEERVNCPTCGARTPVDGETCTHCDEPMPP